MTSEFVDRNGFATTFHGIVGYLIRVFPKAAAISDEATRQRSVIERQPDGKMRVTSGSWDGEKVFLRHQVLEVRNVEGLYTSPGTMNGTRRSRRTIHTDPATNSLMTDDVIDYPPQL